MQSRLLILVYIGLASFSTFAATDIILPSLPHIAHYFSVTDNESQLAIPATLMGALLSSPFWGYFSDYIHRIRVITYGLFAFILGCAICLFAPNFETLVIGRFIIGVGNIVIPIAGFSLIQDIFPGDEGAKYISIIGSVGILAPLIAPLAGGFIEENYGWTGNFIALIAITFPVYILFLMRKPLQDEKIRKDHHVKDFFSAYGIVLQNPRFLAYVLLYAILCSGEWAYLTVSPFYYQETLQIGPEEYGFYMSISALFCMLGTIFSAIMSKWVKVQNLMWLGLWTAILSSFSIFMLYVFAVKSPLILSILFGIFLFGLCIIWGNSTSRALQSAPGFKGTASAVRSLLMNGFYTLGGFIGSIINDTSLLPISLILMISSLIPTLILKKIREA